VYALEIASFCIYCLHYFKQIFAFGMARAVYLMAIHAKLVKPVNNPFFAQHLLFIIYGSLAERMYNAPGGGLLSISAVNG
jgi:hypothetical protein